MPRSNALAQLLIMCNGCVVTYGRGNRRAGDRRRRADRGLLLLQRGGDRFRALLQPRDDQRALIGRRRANGIQQLLAAGRRAVHGG